MGQPGQSARPAGVLAGGTSLVFRAGPLLCALRLDEVIETMRPLATQPARRHSGVRARHLHHARRPHPGDRRRPAARRRAGRGRPLRRGPHRARPGRLRHRRRARHPAGRPPATPATARHGAARRRSGPLVAAVGTSTPSRCCCCRACGWCRTRCGPPRPPGGAVRDTPPRQVARFRHAARRQARLDVRRQRRAASWPDVLHDRAAAHGLQPAALPEPARHGRLASPS